MNDEEFMLRLLEGKPVCPFLVAIDGRCTAGKTTLAGLLQGKRSCNVVHMDDFYLPFAKRTPERMAQPGGNMDFERLLSEVLLPLKRADPQHRHSHRHRGVIQLPSPAAGILQPAGFPGHLPGAASKAPDGAESRRL